MLQFEIDQEVERFWGRSVLALRKHFALPKSSRKNEGLIFKYARKADSVPRRPDFPGEKRQLESSMRALVTSLKKRDEKAWFSLFQNWTEGDRLCFISGLLVTEKQDNIDLFGEKGFQKLLAVSPFEEGAIFHRRSSPLKKIEPWKTFVPLLDGVSIVVKKKDGGYYEFSHDPAAIRFHFHREPSLW